MKQAYINTSTRFVQKILSDTQKEEYSRTFLLWKNITTSSDTWKTNSDVSCFIKSCSVLLQF